MAYDAEHGVNVAECLDLADFLERLPPEQFDMRSFCGTACCMGGWLAINHGHRPIDVISLFGGYLNFGQKTLGISKRQSWELFAPIQATNVQAAAELRHLAATGEVDWSVVL